MPKEGEQLVQNKPLTELNTQKKQQDLTHDQNRTATQNQMVTSLADLEHRESLTRVIGADQFAQAPEQELSPMNLEFSSVVSVDDSIRMKSIRRAVADYFTKKEEYDATTEGSAERARTAEALIREAEAIISSCKWYCIFRHPVSTRGIERKKEVKALRHQVEEVLHSLKLETININFDKKKKSTVERRGKVELREKKDGTKELIFGGKELTYEASDRARLHHKGYLKDLVAEDKRRRKSSWSRDTRKLLDRINNYADIHTTAMHVEAARNMVQGGPKNLQKKYWKKISSRRAKLENERKLLKEIRDLLKKTDQNTMNAEEKELVNRYKSIFDTMVSGTLRVEEGAETIDVKVNKDKVIYRHRKYTPNERVKVDVQDRSKDPLFAHEPCTQDIAQGQMGDCYFLTALVEIVKKDPAMIRSMMRDNGDTVTVRFYKNNTENKSMTPVYVTVPKIHLKRCAEDTLWVQMMELAYNAFLQKESEEDVDPLHKNDDDTLSLEYIGSGGNTNHVFRDIYGRDDFIREGIASAVSFTRKNVYNTSELIYALFLHTGENALLVQEQAELSEYGEFAVLHSRCFDLQGNIKKDADPKDVELCKAIFEKKMKIYEKSQKLNISASFDELEEEWIVSFKDVNDRLLKINERWLKTVPEAKELLERRNRIRNELLPKAKKDSEEYNRLVEERDRINKELNDEGILPYYSYASRERTPGETMLSYEQSRMQQNKALQQDSNRLQDIVREKLKIDLKEKDPQKIKENFGRMKEAIRGLDFSDFKDNTRIFFHMTFTPYNTGDHEKDLREAFETVRLHALRSCETAYDSVEEMLDVKKVDSFTGAYPKNVKDVYRNIRSCQDAGKPICTAIERTNIETKDKGAAGENKVNGLVYGHGYTIMDAGEFDYEGKQILMVKVRNPWAGYTCSYTVDKNKKVVPMENNNKNNGEFWVELTHFTKMFSFLYYEKE